MRPADKLDLIPSTKAPSQHQQELSTTTAILSPTIDMSSRTKWNNQVNFTQHNSSVSIQEDTGTAAASSSKQDTVLLPKSHQKPLKNNRAGRIEIMVYENPKIRLEMKKFNLIFNYYFRSVSLHAVIEKEIAY